VRAPVRQSFRSWQPGDKLEYFFDYVWYPGVVREIRGPFVRIEDQDDSSWGRWTVPEAVRNR